MNPRTKAREEFIKKGLIEIKVKYRVMNCYRETQTWDRWRIGPRNLLKAGRGIQKIDGESRLEIGGLIVGPHDIKWVLEKGSDGTPTEKAKRLIRKAADCAYDSAKVDDILSHRFKKVIREIENG